MDFGDLERVRRERALSNIMINIIDVDWLLKNDHDGKIEKCIIYLADGVDNNIIPLSIAREVLTLFVKMESMIITVESRRIS